MATKKTIAVSEGLRSKIQNSVSEVLCLYDVKEFDELYPGKVFFEAGPDTWDELERTLCDYLCRKQLELQENIWNSITKK